VLRAVGLQRQALDVATVSQCYDDLLVRDQVLFAELLYVFLDDLGAAGVAVLLLHLAGFLADQEVDLARVSEQVLQVADLLQQLRVLVLKLLSLQGGQTA
jgi:hypothetical protein